MIMTAEKVVTRIAPSPTGFLHVGTVRTALFNYLFAKQHGGEFILRLEDTDKERSKKKFEDDIIGGFEWLGIKPDGKINRQSERTELYRKALNRLLKTGSAYEAELSEKGSGKVIRFKNPNKIISFTDLIRGKVTFDTTELGDFVIAKSTEEPLYHLGVVVDDAEMGVTHIIRAEEHISNTPRQILLIKALDNTQPKYAHVPLILSSDRSKLSKRHGAVSVNEYKNAGYLPGALINYLALLGWHPKDDREIFSMEELVKEFDLSRVQKGGAIFDEEKLRSINKKYIGNLSDDSFITEVEKGLKSPILELIEANRERFKKLIPLLRERIEIFSDIKTMTENGDLEYFFQKPSYERSLMVWKTDTEDIARTHLSFVAGKIDSMEENNFKKENIKKIIWDYAEKNGKGSVLWPMRYALSGKERSPDPFVIAEIIGKTETHARINHAIEELS